MSNQNMSNFWRQRAQQYQQANSQRNQPAQAPQNQSQFSAQSTNSNSNSNQFQALIPNKQTGQLNQNPNDSFDVSIQIANLNPQRNASQQNFQQGNAQPQIQQRQNVQQQQIGSQNLQQQPQQNQANSSNQMGFQSMSVGGKSQEEILMDEKLNSKDYIVMPLDSQGDVVLQFLKEYGIGTININDCKNFIRSKYGVDLYKYVIKGVLNNRSEKQAHKKLMQLKEDNSQKDSFIPRKKLEVKKQGEKELCELDRKIYQAKQKLQIVKILELNVNLIPICNVRPGQCVNKANCILEDCRCLAMCDACFSNPQIIQFLTNCPICGNGLGNIVCAYRCIW